MSGLPELTEKDWQKQVLQLATLYGWKSYHPFLSKWSEKGWPDLALVRERLVFAELKRESGTLTKAQVNWIGALQSAGQEVYIWRPSQFDEVNEILRRKEER